MTELDGRVFFIKGDSLQPYRFNDKLVEITLNRKVIDVRFSKEGNLMATVPGLNGILKEIDGNFSRIKLNPFFESWVLQKNNLPLLAYSEPSSIKTKKEHQITVSNRRLQIQNGIKNYIYSSDYKLIDSFLMKEKSPDYFRSVVMNKEGNYLAIPSSNKGLIEFNDKGIVSVERINFPVLNLFIDSKSNLWMSTKEHGIYFFKNAKLGFDKAIHYFPNTSKIVSAEDNSGNIWGYSENDGVFKMNNPFQLYYNTELHYKGNITAIEKVNDTLYYGKDYGKIGAINLKSNSTWEIDLPITDNQKIELKDPLYPITSIEYDQKAKSFG